VILLLAIGLTLLASSLLHATIYGRNLSTVVRLAGGLRQIAEGMLLILVLAVATVRNR
jgi:hypothetical protein